MLWANTVDNKLMIVFVFFPENRIYHIMQIVSLGDNLLSLGDNLHELLNPIFWKKKIRKIFQNDIC